MTYNLIDDYEHWQYTPVIPKLYWDAYSAEERIKRICLMLDKIRAYTDTAVDNFNQLSTDLADKMNKQSARMDEINAEMVGVEKLIKEMALATMSYDPTRGATVTSVTAMRSLLRNADYFGVTVKEWAEKPMTVTNGTTTNTQTVTPAAMENLANGQYPTCQQIAMLGNVILYRDTVPRTMPLPANTVYTTTTMTPGDELADSDGNLTVNDLSRGVIRQRFFKQG